jgi:hypothetical protein
MLTSKMACIVRPSDLLAMLLKSVFIAGWKARVRPALQHVTAGGDAHHCARKELAHAFA